MKKFLVSLIPPAVLTLLAKEPAVVVSGVLAAASDVAAQYGFTLTRHETFWVHAGTVIVLAFITRFLVTPKANVPASGVQVPEAPTDLPPAA